MRFSCQVEVFNRLCASTAQAQSKRQKSTLTVGGYGSSAFRGKLWILHQTAQNGSGIRYKVNSNITGLFSKFVHEGKVTVRFREPAVDLRIMGDPKQLGEFIEMIRNFCTGKPRDPTKKTKITNLETAAKKIEPPPPKKLIIATSKNLRSGKGSSYPSSLEHLQVNNAELEKFDPKIFRLQHLKVLNLEGNQIHRVPKSIDLLSGLRVLNLASNKMGLSAREEHWEWLRCESLRASLQVLDLSNNEILAIPNCLPHLRSLTSLFLNYNNLSRLPNNIGFARNLKTLCLKDNNLSWVPTSLLVSNLDNLDVSDNLFSEQANNSRDEFAGICLKDMAARAVLVNRLKYNDASLPRELIRYLESSCFCLCGKATFPEHPASYQSTSASRLANYVVYDGAQNKVTVGFRKCLTKCPYKNIHV